MLKKISLIVVLLILSNQICFSQINLVNELKSGKKIKLKQIFEIGVWSGDDQETFFKINDVKTDVNGNIYILDSGNHRIQKFDIIGKYICTIGHKGQGPGEFNTPISLFIDNKDHLYVLDKGLLRITEFDKNGNYINSIGISSLNTVDFVVDNDDFLIVLEAGDDQILKKYNKSGTIVSSFCSFDKIKKLYNNNQTPQTGIEKRVYNKIQNITYSKGALSTHQGLIYIFYNISRIVFS